MPGPDYILDIHGLPKPQDDGNPSPRRAPRNARAWLAIRWRCCGVYSRIHRTRDGAAYAGHCPRCARPVRITIGEGGTDCRFFEAG
jgi:hypothetical protein